MLAGAWEGTYSSEETGRNGSIVFTLQAGADSAFGDVVMVPANPDLPPTGIAPAEFNPLRRTPRVLTFSFIGCTGADVTGRLDPYDDPETRERVSTTFEGRLRGNTLAGTFVSLYQPSGHRTGGTWSVSRKVPASP
jgi:hypothetical protein